MEPATYKVPAFHFRFHLFNRATPPMIGSGSGDKTHLNVDDTFSDGNTDPLRDSSDSDPPGKTSGEKMSLLQSPIILIALVILCGVVGYLIYQSRSKPDDGYGFGLIEFKDNLDSNTNVEQNFSELELMDQDGNPIRLKEFIGKSNLVFVVLRGYSTSFCPYCSAQTQRILKRHDEIRKLGSDVVIAYPISPEQDVEKLKGFIKKATYGTRFSEKKLPITLGVDTGLNVVSKLGIEADLSKPATYIIDRSGKVRFAYVGDSLADRPSVDSIIEQLKQINAS